MILKISRLVFFIIFAIPASSQDNVELLQLNQLDLEDALPDFVAALYGPVGLSAEQG